MEALETIVYVSTSTMPMTAEALEALLVEARNLNLETNTTGVLLCSDTNFMQCFEGSPDAIVVTYDRIKRSRKHINIIELLNEPIVGRSFADWQMGFARTTTSELLALSTASWQRVANQGPRVSTPSPGLDYLRQFWKGARR